jgi:hypothetical protein
MSLAKGLISGHDLATEKAPEAPQAVAELNCIREVITLYRGLPAPRGSSTLVARIQQGITAGEWEILR